MKEFFSRRLGLNKKYNNNNWLRLKLLIWGVEDIILPTLLIEMYEQDMRDMLSIFQKDSGELATTSASK